MGLFDNLKDQALQLADQLGLDDKLADALEGLVDKLEGFGFNVIAIDGHDFDAIENALNAAKQVKGKPTAIVMKTVKGKCVSFMENNAGWHGKAPNDAEYQQAMDELNAQYAELEAK